MSPADRLRALLERPGLLTMPGCHDATSAKLIEAAGFELGFMSGFAVSAARLGMPDTGLISYGELVDQGANICRAVSIPMIGDGDTGFGSAQNIKRTVHGYAHAGFAAIMLEDQTYPKRCGHFEGKDVIPKQEMVSKLKAAVDARIDPDMMILARTDARAVEGFEAALDRARAYQEAGADFLFVEAPLTKEELLAIPREVPGIHLCNMVIGGKTPLLPREELANAGYAVVLYANAALQASLLAMQQVLRHLHDTGSVAGIESKLMMFADRQKVLDAEKFSELEKRYA
jgi:2-methylisocitrate lyase-like PEP mutase family enzyme